MSLYNLLFGQNPDSDIVLRSAGLEDANLGRFRDCEFKLKKGEPIVVVYTRNGGGNRKCWLADCECYSWNPCECNRDPECQCAGCVITYAEERWPNFISDKDDPNDCTYALMYFRVIPEYREAILAYLQPSIQEAATPTQEEVITPTQEEAAIPTQEEVMSPTQEEVMSPTQETE